MKLKGHVTEQMLDRIMEMATEEAEKAGLTGEERERCALRTTHRMIVELDAFLEAQTKKPKTMAEILEGFDKEMAQITTEAIEGLKKRLRDDLNASDELQKYAVAMFHKTADPKIAEARNSLRRQALTVVEGGQS